MRRILQVLPFFARRAGVSCVRCMGRARCRAFPPLGGGMEYGIICPVGEHERYAKCELKKWIITSKPPLARLRVCIAHAPVLTHRALRTLDHAKPQQVRFCCGRFAASWYNNLKAAACAAARVHCTRPCADAQGFENIGPCKTAIDAVLLRPLRGVMVYYDHRQKQCGDIGCIR